MGKDNIKEPKNGLSKYYCPNCESKITREDVEKMFCPRCKARGPESSYKLVKLNEKFSYFFQKIPIWAFLIYGLVISAIIFFFTFSFNYSVLITVISFLFVILSLSLTTMAWGLEIHSFILFSITLAFGIIGGLLFLLLSSIVAIHFQESSKTFYFHSARYLTISKIFYLIALVLIAGFIKVFSSNLIFQNLTIFGISIILISNHILPCLFQRKCPFFSPFYTISMLLGIVINFTLLSYFGNIFISTLTIGKG